MPEDAGKKKFIKDFLQKVRVGEGFIEDIWIDRVVRTPGSDSGIQASTAHSLSGRQINNITELLDDDFKHSFNDGYFTFRIVSALKGSGKTSLITYLHELIDTQITYNKFSVVSRFPLTHITAIGGSYNFSVKLYCYMLSELFWKFVKGSESPAKTTAQRILNDYLEQSEVNQLVTASRLDIFRSRFIKYFANIALVFEEFFFEAINEISKVEPQATFAYLIDEVDGLEKRPDEFQETLSIIRSLIKKAAQEFGNKIRLFIYVVGTSKNIRDFVTEDPVIESLIGHQVINLNAGSVNEFEMIKNKINNRIEAAFKGYKDFNNAWQEIQNISLIPHRTLRQFCQEYARAILEIYDRYFKEEPEKKFEGNARDLVEAQCRQQWQSYLSKKAYTLSSISTTTILNGHAFDCYVELLHNGDRVARGFGEAKNYELLSSHLDIFDRWLVDVNFKSDTADGNPPDLAFIISPSCPSLLQRKIELKNIQFIQASKVIIDEADNETKEEQTDSVNINTADRSLLKIALRGTRIQDKTIDKIINGRPYNNLDDLANKVKLTVTAKNKLQDKLFEKEICFH